MAHGDFSGRSRRRWPVAQPLCTFGAQEPYWSTFWWVSPCGMMTSYTRVWDHQKPDVELSRTVTEMCGDARSYLDKFCDVLCIFIGLLEVLLAFLPVIGHVLCGVSFLIVCSLPVGTPHDGRDIHGHFRWPFRCEDVASEHLRCFLISRSSSSVFFGEVGRTCAVEMGVSSKVSCDEDVMSAHEENIDRSCSLQR